MFVAQCGSANAVSPLDVYRFLDPSGTSGDLGEFFLGPEHCGWLMAEYLDVCLCEWMFFFLRTNDISVLRRPNNVRFGTKGALVREWCTQLDFWKMFFNCGKNRPKMTHYSPHATSETKNSRNMEIGRHVARGVWMMPELCVFKLCTALIFSCGKKL